MFRWLLNRIRAEEIGDGAGDVFFWRRTILKTKPLTICLHEFLRSDKDRCLHDHPRSFVAIILCGGYFEEMPVGGRPQYGPDAAFGQAYLAPTELHWRRPGSILCRSAATAHRIVLDPTKPRPWSLVFFGPKVRPWGFWTVNGWREWEKDQPNPICEVQ